MIKSASANKILAVDIGGTYIKATVLNSRGEFEAEYRKVDTPRPCSPASLIKAIKVLASELTGFNRISVGFPGYVKNGVVYTAPQLGTDIFSGYSLARNLEDEFKLPVRMVNDADLQGLGVVSGVGYEMLITLGTGLGSALLLNGVLLPHLELSQHPATKKFIYDDYIGAKALEEVGLKKWNNRVKKMITVFRVVFNYDRLYVGGGNSSKINFPLDYNVRLVSNQDGITGGAKLWQLNEEQAYYSMPFADRKNVLIHEPLERNIKQAINLNL